MFRTDCELWIRSYWNKYVNVFPSFQTIRPGTQKIMINGENFASNSSLIKVKCMDSENRIISCNISWVDVLEGNKAEITFKQAIQKKHTGKLYIRLDSDNAGWLKPVSVAVVVNDINPWISMTIINTCFLFGLIVTSTFCICWRYRQRKDKADRRKQLEEHRKLKQSKLFTTDALDFQLPALH